MGKLETLNLAYQGVANHRIRNKLSIMQTGTHTELKIYFFDIFNSLEVNVQLIDVTKCNDKYYIIK